MRSYLRLRPRRRVAEDAASSLIEQLPPEVQAPLREALGDVLDPAMVSSAPMAASAEAAGGAADPSLESAAAGAMAAGAKYVPWLVPSHLLFFFWLKKRFKKKSVCLYKRVFSTFPIPGFQLSSLTYSLVF